MSLYFIKNCFTIENIIKRGLFFYCNFSSMHKKEVFTTADGSPTFYMKELDEYYHSRHGAVQESNYVFIEKGLAHWKSLHPSKSSCAVFEMGMGTGLNVLLTEQATLPLDLSVQMTTIEAFPIQPNLLLEGDFASFLSQKEFDCFQQIHQTQWAEMISLNDRFQLKKVEVKLEDYSFDKDYDVLFYDAFGARTQPELWEDHVFLPLVKHLRPGGVFVTYSAKGSLRRALEKFGLKVERLPGPPGKREMIRAIRT